MIWIMNNWFLWLIGLVGGGISTIIFFILFGAESSSLNPSNWSILSLLMFIISAVVVTVSKLCLILSLIVWIVQQLV